MEFRILGPLFADAGTGNGPAVIRQPLLQSALAVLLLRANRPCPRSMLIEALWGSEPPGSPEAALRVCISRLRRCLGECAGRLESVGPPGGRAPGHRQQRGYLMTVRPGELDAEEFRDLVAQGQAELDTAHAAAAAASLVHALALWGDPPLPDLPDCEAIAPDVEELTNLRQAAVDALVEAQIAAGQTEHALARLRAAVAADPGRERAYHQLMRAYLALGMRKEALDVYQAARRSMREQQGTEPGQALAVLYTRILAEEMAAESAAHLSAISLRTPLQLGWQVPAPPRDFTGRHDELAAIEAGLSGGSVPVTVVCGGPGAGKSATVSAAALRLRDRFTDGQLYAELGGVEQPRDPQDVLAEMLRAMGVPARSVPPPGPARAAMYRSLLAGRKVLVVADDAAAASQVRPLVPAAGGAAVLVTSRSRLSGLAGATIVELAALPDDAALELLTAAAGRRRVTAEPAAARAIIAACGGLPLAVRLAATALAARPGLLLAMLADDLASERVLDVLAAEDTSVRHAIGSSYRALDAATRAALRATVSVMPGDIPAWALSEAAGSDRTAAERVAAAGLLAAVQDDRAGLHYRVHPLTRAYLREQEPEEHDVAALARLRTGWLRRSDCAAFKVPAVPFVAGPVVATDSEHRTVPSVCAGHDSGADWLDREQANLTAAAEQASSAGAHADAIALASRLTTRLCLTGGYADAIAVWRTIASRATQQGDDATAAKASYYLAAVLAGSHDCPAVAATLLARWQPVLEQAGDVEAAALSCCLLGLRASAGQHDAKAVGLARHAIELSRDEPCNHLVLSCALVVLGLALARMGACQRGARHCQIAWDEARGLSEPVYEAHAIRALAQVLILCGDHDQAADLCQLGVAYARGYGSAVDAARFGIVLGRAQQFRANYGAAMASLRSAADTFRHARLVLDELTARSLLAACARSTEDETTAAAESALIGQLLARAGHDDAALRATAAIQACALAEGLSGVRG